MSKKMKMKKRMKKKKKRNLEGYTAKANQETTCFIFIIIFKVH